MTDRDELARLLNDSDPEYGVAVPDDGDEPYTFWHDQAEAILAAGWRKKPSREELRKVYILAYAQAPREKVTIPAQLCPDDYDGSTVEATSINMEPILDAILALLDGPTETGETRNE